MVPETWSATDRILCQSGPFLPLLPPYGPKESKLQRQKFLSSWAIFRPFSPLTTWKIKILKLTKTPGDTILHICTINDNHMMYGS